MGSRIRRLGAGLGSVLVLLAAAGQVHGDVSTTSGVSLTTNGLTAYATGSWSWPDPTASRDTKFVGFALDWGDVTTGNALGPYHLGDGTPATNEVLRPATADRGATGTFGPMAHTYKIAGTYRVCAVVYDLGSAQPFKTTGWHSLRASGANRNTDNSVDQQTAPPVSCGIVVVTSAAQATPTAPPTAPQASATSSSGQSVGGATSEPGGSTPPPTVTEAHAAAGDGLGLALPLGLLLLSALGGALLLSPRRRRG